MINGEEAPDILYKYRDYEDEYHRELLYNLEMYFPSTEQFNDPFEGNIPYVFHEDEFTPENLFKNVYVHVVENYPDFTDDQISSECQRIISEGNFKDPENLEDIKNASKRRIKKTFGIYSLAKERDNFLMWSHYSKSHTGFCVGFNMEVLWKTVQEPLISIKYDENLPKIRFSEKIPVYMEKLLGTKGEMWSYEKEYRIINFRGPGQKIVIPSNSIKEIILGYAMKPEVKGEIFDFVKSKSLNWHIFEAKLSESHFKLEINKIS